MSADRKKELAQTHPEKKLIDMPLLDNMDEVFIAGGTTQDDRPLSTERS